MELIPAIDLLDGRVVRLTQGRYDAVTVYADDPVEEAARFLRDGATRLHVVDLEGARTGRPAHAAVIERIVRETSIAVQVGGGIRDRATADAWLALGVDRVVLGTAAIATPDWVRALCRDYPSRVVVALDARGGEIAIDGWTRASGVRVEEIAREVDGWGAAAILFTDIERDGTRHGPAVDETAALQRLVRATVIASGGIGSVGDLRALRARDVRAAVCGRALYGGAFTLAEGLQAAAGG